MEAGSQPRISACVTGSPQWPSTIASAAAPQPCRLAWRTSATFSTRVQPSPGAAPDRATSRDTLEQPPATRQTASVSRTGRAGRPLAARVPTQRAVMRSTTRIAASSAPVPM